MKDTGTKPTRVAFVEDNYNVRSRLIERFRFFDEIDLVFGSGTGEEFLETMSEIEPEQLPDVVLMDIELPGASGIETTAVLKEQWPETDVLMFTVFEDEEKIFEAIQAGAAGYLLKDASVGDVVGAILELRRGGAPMSSSVAKRVLRFVQTGATNASRPAEETFDLSAREIEILHQLVAGDTEHAIADKLCISPNTVRTHVKNVYKKLHVHSRASAVRVALSNNLLKEGR
jgi:DNA-binding NarL/FixJ family response regulator